MMKPIISEVEEPSECIQADEQLMNDLVSLLNSHFGPTEILPVIKNSSSLSEAH